MQKTRLRPVFLKETSLTPKGSNPLADVLKVKEAPPVPNALTRLIASLTAALKAVATTDAARDEVSTIMKDVEASLKAQVESGPELPSGLVESLMAVANAAKASKDCKDCKPGAPCKKHGDEYVKAKQMVQKEVEAISTSEAFSQNELWRQMDALTTSIYSILGDEEVADKSAALTQTFSQFIGLVSASAGQPISKESTEMTDIAKGLPEHIQKQFDAMAEKIESASKEAKAATEAATAATARAEKAETDLATMKEARANESLVLRAKEIRKSVPGDDQKFAAVLKKLNDDDVAVLKSMFDAANAAIDTSKLFGEYGEAAKDAEGDTSAEAQLQRIAKEFAVKEGLTHLEAYGKAAAARPDLVRLSTQETRYSE